MWEFSISVGSDEKEIAKFVYQTLKSKTAEFESVVTCFEQDGRIFVLIACPKSEQVRVKTFVERCVLKVICGFLKERFLDEKLILPTEESISKTAFKKALISFDKETDFYLVSKNLDLNKNLYIDSFYNFKLKSLKNKWEELVLLANENSDYLVSRDAFFDLLKFLIDNLEIGREEVDVFEDETGYSIYSKEPISDLECEKLSKEKLVSSIIEICPKRINFFCKSDDTTANFLSKIFDQRVSVCYNKSVETIENFSAIK